MEWRGGVGKKNGIKGELVKFLRNLTKALMREAFIFARVCVQNKAVWQKKDDVAKMGREKSKILSYDLLFVFRLRVIIVFFVRNTLKEPRG